MREIFSGFRAGTITALMAGVATALGQRAMGDVQMALAQHTGSSVRSYGSGPRRRKPGPVRSAGSKLARKALEHKL
jgi:hypothetical protein